MPDAPAVSDEQSPIQHALVLRRVDETNTRRFYALLIERDLFGRVVLIRRWGRIGYYEDTVNNQPLSPFPSVCNRLSLASPA